MLTTVPEIRQLREVVLPRVEWTPELAIAWYENQQRRKRAAPLGTSPIRGRKQGLRPSV